MSVERVLDLADSAAKHQNPTLYKLNLLVRSLKANNTVDHLIIHNMVNLLGLCEHVPPVVQKVWFNHYDAFFSAMGLTSSEFGWFMNNVTTTKLKHEYNNPEAKKQATKIFGDHSQQQGEPQ